MIKPFIIISLAMTLLITLGNTPCEKCDINKVKVVHDKMDSLTFEIVEEFLCTFDKSCISNVEYSEWSNEILFVVLIKTPDLFFQVMDKGEMDYDLILSEIESPVHDLIDLQKVYDNIRNTSVNSDFKNKILGVVIKAANSIDEKIKL